MENASQALLIAGGVLIAVLVLTLGIYIFSSTSKIGEDYEMSVSATELQKFNSKLEVYSKTPRYVKTEKNSAGEDEHKYYTERELRGNIADYSFFDYNTVSDVVSAVNYAYNINTKNNNDSQASVDIIIVINADPYKGSWGIKPDTNVKKNFVYKINRIDSNQRISDLNTGNEINLNDLLLKYSESKLNSNTSDRVYKYGFKGVTHINSETGMIDSVTFTMQENKCY